MKLPPWLWYLLPLAVLLWSASGVLSAYGRYQKARLQVQALEREVEALTRNLPQALGEAPVPLEALPLLYVALFRLAEAQRLQVQSLDPGEAAPTGGVRAWRVRLLLEGPYAGVLGYLEGLPGLGKPLWVEAYTLEPVGERGERLALDLVLRVLAP